MYHVADAKKSIAMLAALLLGLEEGVPGEIVRVSKQYINWVWKIREREIEGWKQEIRGRGDEIQRDDHERE